MEKGISGRRDFFGAEPLKTGISGRRDFWGGPGTFEKGISGRRDFWGGPSPGGRLRRFPLFRAHWDRAPGHRPAPWASEKGVHFPLAPLTSPLPPLFPLALCSPHSEPTGTGPWAIGPRPGLRKRGLRGLGGLEGGAQWEEADCNSPLLSNRVCVFLIVLSAQMESPMVEPWGPRAGRNPKLLRGTKNKNKKQK